MPTYRGCKDCKAPCSIIYKKCSDVSKSGLMYLLKNKDSIQWSTEPQTDVDEAIILHNTNCDVLHIRESTYELCKLKSKCFRCKQVIQRVRSLLGELIEIRDNQFLGVCEYCKQTKNAKKCPRCNFIMNKFLSDKERQSEERQRSFKLWLCRVKHFLEAILEGGRICEHYVSQDVGSKAELEDLLQQLKSPLVVHESTSDFFPFQSDQVSLKNIEVSKDMIDELLIKLQTDRLGQQLSFDEGFSSSPTKMCVCKYFKQKEFDGLPPDLDFGNENLEKRDIKEIKFKKRTSEEKRGSNDKNKVKSLREIAKVSKYSIKKIKDRNSASKVEFSKSNSPKELKIPKSKKQTDHKNKKTGITEEEEAFLKLMQEFKRKKPEKTVSTPKKPEKKRHSVQIPDLPTIQRKEQDHLETKSESFIKCDDISKIPGEMIKSDKIVPFGHNFEVEKGREIVPVMYKVYDSPANDCSDPWPHPPTPVATSVTDLFKSKPKTIDINMMLESKGAFSYALSDRKFIENGMTKLPTEKIMRRMNIYKMKPPALNWFEQHKSSIRKYNSGEILAEVYENANGKWFYKNGALALEYYDTEDVITGHRYVIYSSGVDVTGKHIRQTVLASFDLLGNGVIYDCHGNLRLKYNQSEGLVIDENIAKPGAWRWHALNEPPVLQRVHIDTNLKQRDPVLEAYHEMHQKEMTDISNVKKEQENLMLAIEMENYVKEKACKMLEKFKPFHIKMKAVKVNEYFSMRIMDQANISLVFRDGSSNLRLNVGLLLIGNEIIDTYTAEVKEIATPYDKRPARSKSISNIQNLLDRVRTKNKSREAPKW